jgi:hypothetical protein
MNRNVQYFTGLQRAVGYPPHTAIGLLEDENIAWSNERHGRWLAQTSNQFRNPEHGVHQSLSRNNGNKTAKPDQDPKPTG